MDSRVRVGFFPGVKGSGVTRVERLNMHPREKEWLLAEWKKRLGCGGAVKDAVIELQGDHRQFVEGELKAKGLNVRRIGSPQ